MAKGFNATDARHMYIVPAIVGGKVSGSATSDFANLKKDTLVIGEVTPFTVAANELVGAESRSGGARTSQVQQFAPWGRDAITLSTGSTVAPITVQAGIEYDDTDSATGLSAISKLALDLELGAEVAVIVENTPVGTSKKNYRVEIGTITSTGEISDDSPDRLSFQFTPTSRDFIRAT